MRGIHSFKFGGVYERTQNNFFAGYSTDGAFTFSSVPNFMANIPTSFSGLLPASDNTRGIRQSIAGAYAQDSIRLKSNLTVNLGVRWEMATVPTEVNGKMASLHNISDTQVTVGPMFSNPTLKDFSPRVGLAWDPFKDGKTSIRAGFGIYDALPLGYEFINRFPRTPPFFENGSVNYTAGKSPANFFPNGAFTLLTPSDIPDILCPAEPAPQFRDPVQRQIQRQLSSGTVLTAAYAGSRGYNLYDSQDGTDIALPVSTNPFTWSPSTPTVNPNFARIAGSVWQLPSWYNSAQVGLKKSLSHGLMAQVAWTYQKSVDEGSSTSRTNEFSNTMNNPTGILSAAQPRTFRFRCPRSHRRKPALQHSDSQHLEFLCQGRSRRLAGRNHLHRGHRLAVQRDVKQRPGRPQKQPDHRAVRRTPQRSGRMRDHQSRQHSST